MYKGQITLDPGYFYCPYIPLITTKEAKERGWCLKLLESRKDDCYLESAEILVDK